MNLVELNASSVQAVVEALERALADARAGKVRGVLVYAFQIDGQAMRHFAGDLGGLEQIAAMRLLEHALVDSWAAEHVEDAEAE